MVRKHISLPKDYCKIKIQGWWDHPSTMFLTHYVDGSDEAGYW